MTVLLDTHTVLWALGDPARLPASVAQAIADPGNRVLVSLATLWELSIKVTTGKLVLPEEFFDALPGHGYTLLPIREEHLRVYRSLPLHHRDPFDRLLVAQAVHEGIPVVSCDPELRRYPAAILWD